MNLYINTNHNNNNIMNKNLRKIYEYKSHEPYISLEYYKLREWVSKYNFSYYIYKNPHPKVIDLIEPLDIHKLNNTDKYNISANPVLIDLIKKYPEILNWSGLSLNPHPYAIKLLETNIDKICWYDLSKNPGAIHILKANPDKIEWDSLSCNTGAIELLKERILQNLDIDNMDIEDIDIDLISKQIWWNHLSFNENAGELFKLKPEKISLNILSNNKNAIDLLEINQDKINWNLLTNNENAGHIIEKNLDKINWNLLTINQGVINILENNQDKITDWFYLSKNSNIFTYNYELLEKRISCFKEELIANVNHPRRIKKLLNSGLSIEELCEL